ncbi:MAG TPA: hypothetical protein VFY76_10570, partial [Nocardioides sp.]|nr:hypothetical protein [Nocardioides sp.]
MPHSRPLPRLAALGIATAVMAGLPVAAEAATWSVPRTASVAADPSSDQLEDALMVRINEARAQHGLRRIRS